MLNDRTRKNDATQRDVQARVVAPMLTGRGSALMVAIDWLLQAEAIAQGRSTVLGLH
jgi:hypothetical protein